MDFSLWISSADVRFENRERQLQLNLDRVGVELREQAETGLRYAALLGYAFVDDIQQPETQGLDLSGQYIGVELAYPLRVADKMEIQGVGHFIYQRVDGVRDDQEVSQRWRESAIGMSIWYRQTESVAFWLETQYVDVELSQQASGLVTRNAEFENSDTLSSRLGIDFSTGSGGWVGLYGSFGHNRGMQLKFQRKF